MEKINDNWQSEDVSPLLINFKGTHLARLKFEGENERIIPINDTNFPELEHLLRNRFRREDTTLYFSSNPLHTYSTKALEEFKIEPKLKRSRNNDGAYFRYNNLTQYDLTRQQIYTKNQERDSTNCLIFALKHYSLATGGLTDRELKEIELKTVSISTPKCFLEQISKEYDIPIHLSEEADDKLKHRNYRPQGRRPKLHLGLYKSHYFINDWIDVQKYAATNWRYIYHIPGNNHIFSTNGNGTYKFRQDVKSKPIAVIKAIMENGGFELIEKQPIQKDNEEVDLSQFIPSIYEDKDVDISQYCKLFVPKKLKNTDGIYIFADCETYKLGPDNDHVVFSHASTDLVIRDGEVISPGIVKYYEGNDCIIKFLNAVPNKSIIYYHNLKYDWQQIYEHVNIYSSVCKEGNIYSFSCYYKEKKLEFRDSYNMITMALGKFAKSFGLKHKKAPCPYDLYDAETIKQQYVPFEDALNNIQAPSFDVINPEDYEKVKQQKLDEEKDKFIKESEPYCFIEGGIKYFRHMKYNEFYNKEDVAVLRDGMIEFLGLCKEQLYLDPFNYLTNASLADRYFVNKGCYDDIYEYSGPVRSFIQSAVRGGRVCSYDNKRVLLKGKIQDFDGVSLYPSAMKRLANPDIFNAGGLAAGPPKVIKTLNERMDYYVVEIQITKVNKHRHVPCLSFRTKEGKLLWTNDVPDKTIVVDKTTLEDLINFHGIEFQVVRGLYWDNGFNNKISEVINDLFEWRRREKANDSKIENASGALQNLIKLLMNSAYGRTIMKESKTKKEYKPVAKYDEYVGKNYNLIKEARKINKTTYEIDVYNSITDHKTRTLVGCQILSMSKRIMNEVIYTAEDNGIIVYYTDTDSMHIFDDDISPLSEIYNKEYDRELIGNNLGQFHCDFSVNGYHDIISVECAINGPKSYVDKLYGVNNKTGNFEFCGYHTRMKGINTSEIFRICDKNNITPIEMYSRQGTYKFDLAHEKPKFEYLKNGGVRSKLEFEREITFKGAEKKIERL